MCATARRMGIDVVPTLEHAPGELLVGASAELAAEPTAEPATELEAEPAAEEAAQPATQLVMGPQTAHRVTRATRATRGVACVVVAPATTAAMSAAMDMNGVSTAVQPPVAPPLQSVMTFTKKYDRR